MGNIKDYLLGEILQPIRTGIRFAVLSCLVVNLMMESLSLKSLSSQSPPNLLPITHTAFIVQFHHAFMFYSVDFIMDFFMSDTLISLLQLQGHLHCVTQRPFKLPYRDYKHVTHCLSPGDLSNLVVNVKGTVILLSSIPVKLVPLVQCCQGLEQDGLLFTIWITERLMAQKLKVRRNLDRCRIQDARIQEASDKGAQWIVRTHTLRNFPFPKQNIHVS